MDSSSVPPGGFGVGGVYAGADGGKQKKEHNQNNAINNWKPGQPLDPKDVPAKTPISLLQECCLRKGITPNYELMATEGQVHEPTFMYRCTIQVDAAPLTSSGQGKSKKNAKHLAAKGVLDQIVATGRHVEWGIPGLSVADAKEYLVSLIKEGKVGEKQDGAGAGEAGEEGKAPGDNPIGKLQEMCTKNRWPLPEYDLVEEQGQPHDRLFIVVIKLGKFEQKCEARSKKVAKRMAAERMMQFLSNMPKDAYDGDDDALAERFRTTLRGLGHRVLKPLTTSDVQHIESFFAQMRINPSEGIRAIKKGRHHEMKMTDYHRMLAKISEEYSFPLNYVSLGQRQDGQYQCLVQLSTMPVAVCYGHGETEKEAHYSASRNALEYLKVMAKSST